MLILVYQKETFQTSISLDLIPEASVFIGNPDWSALTNYLITVDPFTGERAYVLKQDFRPIKDLKNTDVANYNQYYGN